MRPFPGRPHTVPQEPCLGRMCCSSPAQGPMKPERLVRSAPSWRGECKDQVLSPPSFLQAVRKQEWTAIIPNSQLIVIPYPHNVPRSWSAKLYLTPSNIVLLTAIALIGVCIFILAIIGVLHWQEKKADDREKRQEAHRFHFDAM
ncbi:T-cell immunomodulatory protein [Myotis davidii]|uniref:T-cell immunomodulatory protein n=1 Tax=Myotis davidii TaxID=225400 RepID=L5LTH3_MYODS|nr:T-cell immunomodulatory protein [Myotis davidii]